MARNTVQSDERAMLKSQLQQLLQQQRELVASLHHGQDQFKRLARSVWSVQEQERRKLARDLHDGIGQNLTAIVNLIGLALQSPARERGHLEKARSLAEMTLQETRALSRLLRPTILDDLGLEPALRWLTRTMAEANSLRITLDLPQLMPALPGEVSTLVFRVIQEALTNTAKYAGAKTVDVALRQEEGKLLVRVHDDGHGCDLARAMSGREPGSGLSGLRDRVRAYEGRLHVESAVGKGFQLTTEIPLPSEGVSA